MSFPFICVCTLLTSFSFDFLLFIFGFFLLGGVSPSDISVVHCSAMGDSAALVSKSSTSQTPEFRSNRFLELVMFSSIGSFRFFAFCGGSFGAETDTLKGQIKLN